MAGRGFERWTSNVERSTFKGRMRTPQAFVPSPDAPLGDGDGAARHPYPFAVAA
jgi:hypothetical protein